MVEDDDVAVVVSTGISIDIGLGCKLAILFACVAQWN